ncbi:Selenocysteine insertion sequence-binding protein 2 [Liparis tanakae]|uniref:Selenocysteine insertion sequence-binding protein 2 n=1 Tax=Liparis tanakae TaxID=230148 RepID=A0A4Z2FSE5_9TELE|nr:Selenocysteine insertion sequence-binding protein 2 [Liparis tanakae]
MDKFQGGTLPPAIQPCDQNQQRQRGKETADPHTDTPPTLMLPNPHVSDRSFRGNTRSSGLTQKQQTANTNGGPAGKGLDVSRSHGYSSSRRVRETRDDFLQRDRTARGPQAETSKGNNGSPAQSKVMENISLDAPKKGYRGARSLSNSAEKSKPSHADFVPFEVKMTDFPELAGGSLGKAQPPLTQKECWGPTPPSSSPQKQTSASSWNSVRRGCPTQTDPKQIANTAEPDSSAAAPAQPAGNSWANVASQPPKKPVPKEKTNSSKQTEEVSAQEGAPGKKKRKKKKKKAQGAGDDAEYESEEPTMYQELPKFEDEEEFPGLTPSQTVTDRLITSSYAAKLCNEENQRDGVMHQSADHTKEISPAAKTQPTETSKKGQKAEKVSGKKSKVPVQLDIGNMLVALEKKQSQKSSKQDAKPVILSVGGGLPAVQKQPLVQKKLPWQQDKIAHNPLDSTSPLVKKGKQREVILKEREERKQKRLLDERGLPSEYEVKAANDDANEEAEEEEEEEPCETNATASDEVGSPTEELDDPTEFNGTNQEVREGVEEAEKDEIVEPQPTSPVLCPVSRPKIHSRKFRDYCSQKLSKDVDECVTALLKELVRFQDRLYQKDPMKARMKRRIVMGLREVLKHLKLRKVKCVVISPNCERIQSKGGLDEALYTIIDTCREQGVPFVFALSRKALGRCVNKAVPVSLVGIFNYDGAQDFYHKMIELSSEARTAYEVMVSSLEQTGQADAEAEEAEILEGKLQISSLAEEAEPGPDTTQPEEPEYIKIWKKMLEKDCNHTFLNFEEQMSSMHLDSVWSENTDEDDKS